MGRGLHKDVTGQGSLGGGILGSAPMEPDATPPFPTKKQEWSRTSEEPEPNLIYHRVPSGGQNKGQSRIRVNSWFPSGLCKTETIPRVSG